MNTRAWPRQQLLHMMHRAHVVSSLIVALIVMASSTAALAAGQSVWLLDVDGPIGPATADYFISNLHAAERADAELFVLQLDTPGGLDRSMRDMIKAILSSTVPVATYVAPNGSRAASAGTYLMYASHIAAMAPATNIGSSTPVSMGGESPLPMPGSKPEPEPEKEPGDKAANDKASDESPAPLPGTPMERKVLNDAVAYIRSLAELRGRNKEWAEKTVRDAANLPASEALAKQVIDLVAPNLDDLLAKLNGRTIKVRDSTVTLDLNDPVIHQVTLAGDTSCSR
ncbi:MAG: hypothetical protein R3F24_11380 [Gammaproteobacteria bacterium]